MGATSTATDMATATDTLATTDTDTGERRSERLPLSLNPLQIQRLTHGMLMGTATTGWAMGTLPTPTPPSPMQGTMDITDFMGSLAAATILEVSCHALENREQCVKINQQLPRMKHSVALKYIIK